MTSHVPITRPVTLSFHGLLQTEQGGSALQHAAESRERLSNLRRQFAAEKEQFLQQLEAARKVKARQAAQMVALEAKVSKLQQQLASVPCSGWEQQLSELQDQKAQLQLVCTQVRILLSYELLRLRQGSCWASANHSPTAMRTAESRACLNTSLVNVRTPGAITMRAQACVSNATIMHLKCLQATAVRYCQA